jgi:hypothetical protein
LDLLEDEALVVELGGAAAVVLKSWRTVSVGKTAMIEGDEEWPSK